MRIITLVVVILALLSLAAASAIPTSSVDIERADTISRLSIKSAMYDGFDGVLLAQYYPSNHVAQDLQFIKAAGFDGIIVRHTDYRKVRRFNVPGFIITDHPADFTIRTDNWWASLARANSLWFTGKANIIGVQTWYTLQDGIDTGGKMFPAVSRDRLYFYNTTPKPMFDHYEVFVTQDGQHLQSLTMVAPSADYIDLRAYILEPGTYTVYVKMVAKAFGKNILATTTYRRR